MFLLTAVSEVFLLLGWVWQSDCLCSPTVFYQNCWIRRFPGLAVDLEQSQQRGAHLLKMYPEVTAQQCGRTCCLLKSVSCNLAVFDYETNNCLHVYCPELESCILRHRINVVLYNITPGIDPDLLVFDKLSFKDLNVRSSFNKWERHGSARISDSEKCQDATTSPGCLPSETSPVTMAQDLATSSSSPSTTSGSIDRTTTLIVPLGPTSASLMVLSTSVTDTPFEKKSSTAHSENVTTSPTSLPPIQHDAVPHAQPSPSEQQQTTLE
ncbi:hypothetical protein lerEdw1_011970 [Lerista edwardsae]|nr:hypothetical protein lerEdw1_011970 [Lerista edwardsae]